MGKKIYNNLEKRHNSVIEVNTHYNRKVQGEYSLI